MEPMQRTHAECVGDEVTLADSPRPRHFHSCPSRRAVLKDLWFGLSNGEAAMLTAQPGLGKTLLCRELLQRLPVAVRSIYLAAPENEGRRLPERIFRTMEMVRRTHATRDSAAPAPTPSPWAVIIDEAHRLDAATLERLADWRDHVTRQGYPAGLLLVGRPSLESTMAQAHLLDTQVTLRSRLTAFPPDETGSYLSQWAKSHAVPRVRFSESANRIVHYATGGTPGLINQVCLRILERARTRGTPAITGLMAARAAWAVSGT